MKWRGGFCGVERGEWSGVVCMEGLLAWSEIWGFLIL